jgi:glycosyltransferase involved in cell wall biosynthesis
MVRVLLDARIDSPTGMGRYSRCLAAALERLAPPSVQITVLRRTGTPRYTAAEMGELTDAAQACRADLIHLTDYRVPLYDSGRPLVTTVHDVMRLTDPDNCDTDEGFVDRFSRPVFEELLTATQRLRVLAALPPGVMRPPRSTHEEFYARMLAYSCRRSTRIITPTHTVARQLGAALGGDPPIHVSPWGLDHFTVPSEREAATSGYLLYVGQTGRHKNLATLLDAYLASQAAAREIPLKCVGRDFRPNLPAHNLVIQRLGRHGHPLGDPTDDQLAGLYAHAAAVIHLADDEGFGFPPLEALATGTRVIVSDIPVLHETLNGYAAFVDHTRPESAAHAIDEMLATPDTLNQRSARIQWSRQYTWHRHARDILDTYRSMQPGAKSSE